jgi:hypothetical protein
VNPSEPSSLYLFELNVLMPNAEGLYYSKRSKFRVVLKGIDGIMTMIRKT